MSYFRWNAGRKRQGSPTLESQPGAHTGSTRKYIPGYADSNIVFLNTSTGNDANTGASIAQALLTYSAAATAAGSTKKIRLVNSATLTADITKPTEATIGTTSSIASSSLTAPISSLTASTTIPWTGTPVHVAWSPKLKKWFGVSAADIASSHDGVTWTIVETFSGYSGRRIFWDQNSQRLYVLCSSGTLLYSTDGATYTGLTVGSTDLYAFAYSTAADVYVLAGSDLTRTWFSTDGTTWQAAPLTASNGISKAVTAFDSIFLFSSDGEQFRSDNGATWTRTAPFGGYEIRAAAYMDNASLLIVGDVDGAIYSSADGTTWTSRRGGSGAEVFDMTYVPELEYLVLTDSGRVLTRTANGTAYTSTGALAAYSVGEQIYGVSYSPLLGQIITVGGNTGSSSDNAAYGPAFVTTISAPVAGFSIQAVQYSGTVTAYNCTLKQPGTTAALSLDSCRVTESGSHISNNAVTATATLIEGDIHYTGVYAAANALDVNLNTISGTLYIYNGSTTNYERIRDNIIENGVRSSYPVTVASGNTRGTSSDGTIFGQFCTTSDPMFVDTTDYKLKRVLDGYQYDSPMVAAAQYYYNAATTQTFRDNGAWSYNESAATYKYQRTFNFTLPATVIGSTIDFIRHNRANLHTAEDGTPDAVNTPDSRWEEIVMSFKTLPSDHIDFINWLESQVDMTCDISLAPSTTPTTSITASGATAAGNAVITVTDNSTIDSGDILTIDGYDYTVLYTYSTDKIVLDRITTTALTDTESIAVKYDSGFGEYQYVPQLERRLSRWYETDDSYARGLIVRFARKLP